VHTSRLVGSPGRRGGFRRRPRHPPSPNDPTAPRPTPLTVRRALHIAARRIGVRASEVVCGEHVGLPLLRLRRRFGDGRLPRQPCRRRSSSARAARADLPPSTALRPQPKRTGRRSSRTSEVVLRSVMHADDGLLLLAPGRQRCLGVVHHVGAAVLPASPPLPPSDRATREPTLPHTPIPALAVCGVWRTSPPLPPSDRATREPPLPHTPIPALAVCGVWRTSWSVCGAPQSSHVSTVMSFLPPIASITPAGRQSRAPSHRL
jgi:hypothetical protein